MAMDRRECDMTVADQKVSERENAEHRARPPQKRAQRTRDALITGAARTIACGGSGVTVNDLIQAAGVTKGGMYFHFPSKDAVVHAVVDQAARQCEFLRAHRPSTGDTVADVQDLLGGYFTHAKRYWSLRAAAVLWTDLHYEDVARAATYHPLRAAVLALLTSNGRLPTISVDTADAVMAIVCGVTTTAGPGGFGDGGDLDTVLRLTGPVIAAAGAVAV